VKLDSLTVRALLGKRISRAPQPLDADGAVTSRQTRPGDFANVRFVPARWLALALAILGELFSKGRISKFGMTALVWSFTPRRLKIAAAGFAIGAMIVFVGAIAAIALLALQLT